MFETSDALSSEYQRWCEVAGEEDPYVGEATLGIHDVLRAHFLIAEFFAAEGRGLGGVGPRDINLLHSALLRQHVGYEGVQKWTGKYDICATLMYGLIMDHPFHDANKRTAFLTALYHLEKLGRCPSVDQKTFEEFTVKIANHDIRRFRQFKELRKISDDPEVAYIARFLRQNTRNIDKRYYAITFSDLKRILKSHGYDLTDPKGNRIDIVRLRRRRKLISREVVTEQVWLGQIGFPRWTAQVGKGAIRTVREVCNLRAPDGVDSEAFYRGADSMRKLIAAYQEPLRRLAER